MYYVTAYHTPRRHYWLAGPFATHEEALAMVDAARREASRRDCWMDVAAYGTARVKAPPYPVGQLNAALGVEVAP